MKKIFCFIACSVLISCEDAVLLPKEYPVVAMESVIVHKDSVEFFGNLTQLGDLPITGHGFLWSEGAFIDSSKLYSKVIQSPAPIGRFKLNVQSDIQKNKSYTVRPFILTENFTLIGSSVTFLGEGSLKPLITGFNPKTGYFGDTVNISGRNFSMSESRTKVLFGAEQAKVVSVSNEEIKVVLPKKLANYGEVQLSIRSGEHIVSSSELFTLAGHQVLGFSPSSGYIGETEISIDISYFEGFVNKVRVGGYDATILEENNYEIRVRLPYVMEVREALIEVEINGNPAFSEEAFVVKSRWSQLNDFPEVPRVKGYFGVLNDEGYLIGGSRAPDDGLADFDEVWRYNFDSDQWQNLGAFPNGAREMAIGFPINEKLYYGGGHFDIIKPNFDFWEFDPALQIWTQMDDLPLVAEDVVYFTLNNKGYLIQTDNREVWEFNPVTKEWTSIGFIAEELSTNPQGRDLFFQSNEKAYFCPVFSSPTNSFTLYEFDPSDPNFLQPVTDLPFRSDRERYLTGFIIDNEIFVGGDDYYNKTNGENPDFWKYKVSSDTWQRMESFLGEERALTNSFTKDGFGYTFFGEKRTCCNTGNTEVLASLWKYDPNK